MAIVLTIMAVCAWIPDFLTDAPVAPYITTILLTILVGLELMVVLYRIGITRFYAALPYTLYVVLTAAFPSLHSSWLVQVSLSIIGLIILLLYRSQQETSVQHTAFSGTMLLLIASIVMPAVVWLIPVFWLGLIYIHTLSLRGMLAAFLAVGVFVLYFVIAQYLFEFSNPYAIPYPHWILHATEVMSYQVVELIVIIVCSLAVAMFSVARLAKEGSAVRFSVIVFSVILLQGSVMALFPEGDHNNIALVVFAVPPIIVNALKQKDFVI